MRNLYYPCDLVYASRADERFCHCDLYFLSFFQEEDGIRYVAVTGVQTCALPILSAEKKTSAGAPASIWRARSLEEANENRSEERRVGKECRSRWSAFH